MKCVDVVKELICFYNRLGIRYLLRYCYRKISKYEFRKYIKFYKNNKLDEISLMSQKKEMIEFKPKISLVVPLYKTPKKYLVELIDSILNQTYSNWELCMSEGSGNISDVRGILDKYISHDPRFKVTYANKPLNISDNTNCALKLCSGDYIGFVDHDDLLAPNLLYECVKAINIHDDIKVIYTDEDKISMDGATHFQPHFKPDFNEDLLNSTNYFCHFFLVEKKLAKKVGGLNPKYDGAQDYDFVLRCTELTDNIYHIPKVLYHWRAHMNSTAEQPESKLYAFEAGVRVLQAHYKRIGLDNTVVSNTSCLGVYRTKYLIVNEPLVSIIIPNKDHIDELSRCLKSIERCLYNNYEILIVENNSVEDKTFDYYKEIEKRDRIKVLIWEGEFNFSKINNWGASKAKGDYILFLNNDTEIINNDCIHEMLGFCMRENTGIVGARLYYEDNLIQHAGVVVGLGGCAGHIFLNTPKKQVGYFARIITQQDYSAVTGACMMVKKEVFNKVGGFDPEFAVAFNDIDFCLRVRKEGYLVVYNPYAELYHYESKTRGADKEGEKKARLINESQMFTNRWNDILTNGDPYYNINLSTTEFDCRLR